MKNDKTKKLVTLSLFVAIIVVLQMLATYVNFGGFPITLTLVPIIIAGAIYGPLTGLFMGFIFGLIVDVCVLLGLDPNGSVMLSIHPFITLLACIVKGCLAGFISALAYKYIVNKKIGIFVSAALAPLINTTTFFIFLILFFDSSFTALVAGLTSINFVIELVIDMLLAPGILRIINMRKK